MFYPLFGDRVFDWPGHVIDLVTVFATIFGLATSLGLGAAQINVGLSVVLERLAGGGVPFGAGTQLAIIAVVTAITGISVGLGIDKGLKRLSSINVYLMILLMLFVLAVGPTRYLLEGIIHEIGFYVQHLPRMSLFTETFLGALPSQAGKSAGWQDSWTIFYWGWWIAWSPFVGLFIARISRGRSIRQMILGVLLLPTGFSMAFLGSFGGLAVYTQLELGGTIQQTVVEQGSAYAMFELLGAYPLSTITSIAAVGLVVTFFVTSADSGSQVIALVTAGGKLNVSQRQRMLWAVVVGVVAAALLVGGGLNALQTAAITTGLPFAGVILILIYTLFKGLQEEHRVLSSIETPPGVAGGSNPDSPVPQTDGGVDEEPVEE
jgi:choline/glycine/proline betaine transport protein